MFVNDSRCLSLVLSYWFLSLFIFVHYTNLPIIPIHSMFLSLLNSFVLLLCTVIFLIRSINRFLSHKMFCWCMYVSLHTTSILWPLSFFGITPERYTDSCIRDLLSEIFGLILIYFYLCLSGEFYWHKVNRTISPMPMRQSWRIYGLI